MPPTSIFLLFTLILPNIQGLDDDTLSPSSEVPVQIIDGPNEIGLGYLLAKQSCVLSFSETFLPGNLSLALVYEEGNHPLTILQRTFNEIEPFKYTNDFLTIFPQPDFRFNFQVIYQGIIGEFFTSPPPSGICRLYPRIRGGLIRSP